MCHPYGRVRGCTAAALLILLLALAPELSARNGNHPRGKVLIVTVAEDTAAKLVTWPDQQPLSIKENLLPLQILALLPESTWWKHDSSVTLAVVLVCIAEASLILLLILNVRRRRHAEKALIREKILADAVIESLPGVFLLQDEAGKNLRWNKNAESLARYHPAEVATLGNVSETYREAAKLVRQRVLTHGSGEAELDMLLRNGRTAPFFFSGVKVELEGKPFLAAVGIDLTETKRAEEAVRRSEQELRSLVENAPYGIGTISVRQDRFLRANPAMVKLLGYSSEAEILRVSVSRDLQLEGDAQGFRDQRSGADFFSAVEFHWQRKDGRALIVRASGRRVRATEEAGDLIEIIAEDVTTRRSLEEQLRQAQKLEALGQLSGSVAHDFNNLLSVIIGYSELLSANPASEGPMRTHLETIKRAGERAASLTSQLLAFSRRQVLQPSVVNLNSLVRETQKMLQRLMREDVVYSVVLDPTLWKTKADPSQIVQVMMNLAINARDAMPRGGTLTIVTANVTFNDETTIKGVDVAPGHYVKLSISDTGIGMDENTQGRIFEPFFTTKEAGKGTGLGLATVYGIVKQSGGYIFCDSEPGKGATFTIYLPQFDMSSGIVAASPEAGDGKVINVEQGSETILVVEDEAAFRDLLRDGLQARGYHVLVAANGVDALQVAEQYKGSIRLLVTDVIMPQMSGPELARSLRASRNIPVLYMSGYTDDKLRDISESGELTLMRKPFYIDELLRRITDILARQQAGQTAKKSPIVNQ